MHGCYQTLHIAWAFLLMLHNAYKMKSTLVSKCVKSMARLFSVIQEILMVYIMLHCHLNYTLIYTISIWYLFGDVFDVWLVILFLSRKTFHAKQTFVLSSSMKLGPGLMCALIIREISGLFCKINQQYRCETLFV